jgi:hypothetical protein
LDAKRKRIYPHTTLRQHAPALTLCLALLLTFIAWRGTVAVNAQASIRNWRTHRRQLKHQADMGVLARDPIHQHLPSGTVQVFPGIAHPTRLLLASHGRLMWYSYATDEVAVLHEGQGVYYGVFPGEELDLTGGPATVWVVSRPHNWRPASSQEWLLQLDSSTGRERRRVAINSRFTHDTVRRGGSVFVADTGGGAVVELEFPEMREVQRLGLFTLQEHVNTLAPTGNDTVWAMLHNLGPVSPD